MWLEPFHELRLGHEADDALDCFAVLEQDHRRDAADAEVLGSVLVFVDVELDDLELARLLDGDLLEHWANHAARTAPLCPEIDQDRRLALDLGFKRCVGNLIELSHVGQSS